MQLLPNISILEDIVTKTPAMRIGETIGPILGELSSWLVYHRTRARTTLKLHRDGS